MKKLLLILLCVPLIFSSCKEVVNSFNEVNKGIETTTESIVRDDIYNIFEDTRNQVKPYKDLAFKLKLESEEITEFIQEMKYSLVLEADNKVFLGKHKDEEGNEIEENIFEVEYSELNENDKSKNIAHLDAKDSRSPATNLFDPESNDGRATILKNKISNFRDTLKLILEIAEKKKLILPGSASNLKINIDQTLSIDTANNAYGADKVSWEIYNFYDMPAVAALTLLSKWQADIRNMEAEVIGFLVEEMPSSPITIKEYDSIYYYNDGTVEKKIIIE